MEFQLPISIDTLPEPIAYGDKIFLIGSCFTEHIGNKLAELKFETLQNPNGIIFDPASVGAAMTRYISNEPYREEDLVYFNEVWQSWQHHSVFSHMDRKAGIEGINASLSLAHRYLKEAKWVIITLGTAFSYRLVENGMPVANCHRAPAPGFDKHLMTIEEINASMDHFLHRLFRSNPAANVIFTVSPVRHVRDGVIENNRSKARLIEAVHHVCRKFDKISYFPAYELVIDVLRDYRFYDIDLVHPNYQATTYVLEQFARHCIGQESQKLMEEIRKIVIARKHKPFQPATEAHKRFLLEHLEKTRDLARRYPLLDWREEEAYFSKG